MGQRNLQRFIYGEINIERREKMGDTEWLEKMEELDSVNENTTFNKERIAKALEIIARQLITLNCILGESINVNTMTRIL